MKSFLLILRSEWLKLRKSNIWLLILVSPILTTMLGMVSRRDEGWLYLLSEMSALHAMLFIPLLTGVFAAFVCRYEHAGGGWKQVLALPVSRTSLYVAKLSVVAALMAAMQLLFLAGLLALGAVKGIQESVPWMEIGRSLLGGWVASLPLAALQMAVSVAWASFAAPLALNVIFTLPNMLVANSADYGPYYPWAQPMLTMIPREKGYGFGAFNVPLDTLLYVIVGGFLLFFISGLTYFRRKEI